MEAIVASKGLRGCDLDDLRVRPQHLQVSEERAAERPHADGCDERQARKFRALLSVSIERSRVVISGT